MNRYPSLQSRFAAPSACVAAPSQACAVPLRTPVGSIVTATVITHKHTAGAPVMPRFELMRTAVVVAAIAVGVLSATATAHAQTPAAMLREANEHILRGRYDDATATLDRLNDEASAAVNVAIARVQIDLRFGRYSDAIDRLKAVATAGAKSADYHAARAEVLMLVGQYDEAITAAQAALKRNDKHCKARYLLGQLYEIVSRYDDAIKAYSWFDDQMRASLPDRADQLTYLGEGFLRHSIMTLNPRIKEHYRHVVNNVFQEAFDFVDENYWPARLATAMLLLEKHNPTEAADDLEFVKKTNPRLFELPLAEARTALEAWNFEEVEKKVGDALTINPNCVDAFTALAECRMLERRYGDAAVEARKALGVNPNSVEALSLLATAQLRDGDKDGSQTTLARIAAFSPNSAVPHRVMGSWLSAARQYEAAEAEFKRAIELNPWWSDPQSELGLMYMQSGQEAEARQVLESSWKLDPFNRFTYNTLELLDQIDRYARNDSPHFILRFHADEDAAVIPWMIRYLEEIHGELSRYYDVQLPRSTIIEVFPAHDEFSVRITGRPWIATVGACTGPVIALAAPRRGAAIVPYNWQEVLRHEFTHTVTLAATGNRIPHWMTEGLAVHQERGEKQWSTREMLSNARRTGRLFTLDTIDWGFMRPRRADDRSLAYAQSEWMIEFIVEQFGQDRLPQMLAGYRNGRTQPQVLADVLQVTPQEFIERFTPWADAQLRSWGWSAESLPTRDETIAKIDALDEADTSAMTDEQRAEYDVRRGEQYALLAEIAWCNTDVDHCEPAVREALKIDPKNPRGLLVMSRLLIAKASAQKASGKSLDADDTFEEASQMLRRLVRVSPDQAEAIKYKAMVEQNREEWGEARNLWETYREKMPLDPASYSALAGMMLKDGQPDKALPLLIRVYDLNRDDAQVTRNIAGIYREKNDREETATWLLRGVATNPYDYDLYLEIGNACIEVKRFDDARLALDSARALKPGDGRGFEAASRLAAAQGEADQAAELLEKAKSLGWSPEPGP